MIKILQNEDFQLVLELQYADTLEHVDLTGVSAFSEMRSSRNGDLAATGSCGVNTENGQITVTYSAAQTANLEEGDYGFDIWVVDNSSKKHPIWEEEHVRVLKPFTQNFGA